MLKHTKQLHINPDKLRECIHLLRDPHTLFGSTENLEEIKPLDNNLYNIKFKWVKFGRVWIFDTTMVIHANNTSIRYVSTSDSKYKCKFEIKYENDKVILECEFNVGLVRNLIVKAAMNSDFKRFVEAIGRGIEEVCGSDDNGDILHLKLIDINIGDINISVDGVSCLKCLFYDRDSKKCSILSSTVSDHSKPPCGGRYYIERY